MALTADPFLPKALSKENTNLADRLREIANRFDTFDGPRSSQNAPRSGSARSLKEIAQFGRPSSDLSAPKLVYIAQSSSKPSSQGNKAEDVLVSSSS